MTEPRGGAANHPLARFVNESLRSAGTLALVLLIVDTLLRATFTASPARVLAIVVGVGTARTAFVWALKAKLRSRWPAVDSLT